MAARKWASFTVIRQVTFNREPEGLCKLRLPHNRAKGGLSQDSQNIQQYSSYRNNALCLSKLIIFTLVAETVPKKGSLWFRVLEYLLEASLRTHNTILTSHYDTSRAIVQKTERASSVSNLSHWCGKQARYPNTTAPLIKPVPT